MDIPNQNLVLFLFFQIIITRPPNNFVTFMLVVTIVLFIFVLYENGFRFHFLCCKNFWAVSTVLFCTAMTSGQMWNHIENPPFFYENQDGELRFIHQASKSQFLFETYLVLMLSILLYIGPIFVGLFPN